MPVIGVVLLAALAVLVFALVIRRVLNPIAAAVAAEEERDTDHSTPDPVEGKYLCLLCRKIVPKEHDCPETYLKS